MSGSSNKALFVQRNSILLNIELDFFFFKLETIFYYVCDIYLKYQNIGDLPYLRNFNSKYIDTKTFFFIISLY